LIIKLSIIIIFDNKRGGKVEIIINRETNLIKNSELIGKASDLAIANLADLIAKWAIENNIIEM